MCGICFTGIHPVTNPRGRLNSCSHLFCAYCIKEWAQSTNVCPYCKARFTRIFMRDSAGNEEVTKVRKRNYKRWEEDDEDNEGDEASATSVVVCGVCAQGDNAARMILCDSRQCAYTVHLDCLQISERPADFFCPECTLLRSATSCVSPDPSLSSSLPLPTPPPSGEKDEQRNDGAPRPAPVPPPRPKAQKMTVAPPAWLQQAVESGAQLQRKAGQRPQSIERGTLPHCLSSPRPASAIHEAKRSETRTPDSPSDNSQIRRSAQAAMEQYLQRQEQRNNQTSLTRHRQFGDFLHGNALPQSVTHRSKRLRSGTHRLCGSGAATATAAAADDAILDPATRRREEEALGRRLALEMLPILRRNRYIQENQLLLNNNGNITPALLPTEPENDLRERELYADAMEAGRRMARERIEAKVAGARLKKERLIRVQAMREAAALVKLAKIIASRKVASRET